MSIYVPPEGSLSSRIAFVGEGPGQEELRNRRPFTGPVGKQLDELLAELGLRREDVYLTNVEKTSALKPDLERQRTCAIELVREFERMPNLNVIVPLGEISLAACGAWEYLATKVDKGVPYQTPEGAITAWRGSIIPSFFGIKMVPTWHPSYYMRGAWKLKPIVFADFERALAQSEFREIRRPTRTFHTGPKFYEAIEWLHHLEQADSIAVDIETFGWGFGKTFINCIGFAPSASEAYCIPIMRQGRAPYWTPDQELQVWRAIQRVLVASCKKYFHNGMFDINILNEHYIKVTNFYHDSMLSHHLLYPEYFHGLDFVSSIYTEEPYYKDDGKNWNHSAPIEKLWIYNCRDVCVTIESGQALEDELHESGMWEYFHSYVMALTWPLMEMQRIGIGVDRERLARLNEWLAADLAFKQAELNEQAGFNVNVKSPKDIEALFAKANIRITKTTKTGKPKLDEDSLREYCRQASANRGKDVTLGDDVLAIREKRTLMSNFTGLTTDEDGMYHMSFLIHGTKSGRLSSRAARDENNNPLGPQMQNIPHEMRGVFKAADGKTFISGDLKQAEAIYVACDARDEKMMHIFNSGGDIHKFNASIAFSKPTEEITKEQRDVAKRITHGFDYDMSARKSVQVVARAGHYITEHYAKQMKSNYFNACPGIPAWQNRIGEQVRVTKQLIDPFGRKRHFFGTFDDEMLREALSQNPQATVAYVTNNAIIRLYESLPSHARLVLQVHDEVLVECDADKWLDVAHMMHNAMTLPFRLHEWIVTIPVDLKVGPYWHCDMQEVRLELESRPKVFALHEEA